ncbi:uncharacterized protein LOC134531678 [Bacillus rossius redtenbacheri]|uniref:uncharacterized protein LOC134531678 n=1 Tax=Bacillus rossius redtenbacheri TaxID=93214 RepID=UPI002FDCF3A3
MELLIRMNLKLFLLVSMLCMALSESRKDSVLPTKLGQFSVPFAAFVQVFKSGNQNNLFVSTFEAYAFNQPDHIYYFKNPGRYLGSVNSWRMTSVDSINNYWPNDVIYTPKSVVGREGIIWTSGFLVPTKTHGKLNIYFTDVEPFEGPYNIASNDAQDWSYHRVIWADVNHDGSLDAVAARFDAPFDGSPRQKQLLWLENPGNGFLEGWRQHVVAENASDVHFQLTHLTTPDGVRHQVLISAEFFNERLTLRYSEQGNFWTDNRLVKTIVIDDTPGQTFDVYLMDLNRDGKEEIVLTAYNKTHGNVFVYDIPQDFRSQRFPRRTIASGFVANDLHGAAAMTPGCAKLFYKSREHERSGDKPYLFLSGDDDGKHYILVPNSEDKHNWQYTTHLLENTFGNTAGAGTAVDLDGDGYTEIVSAGYTAGQVYVYSYDPWW